MSIVEYEKNSTTGRNLSASAAVLLLVTGTNLSYADEIFAEMEFPTAFVKTVEPLTFTQEQNIITEYTPSINFEELEEEMLINFKMPPIKQYKRKARVIKKTQALPKIDIPELV